MKKILPLVLALFTVCLPAAAEEEASSPNLFGGDPDMKFWFPPYAENQPEWVDGIYVVNLGQASGKPMAVVEITLPPGLEEGETYIFSFEVRAKPSSALIVTVPQPDASGKKDNKGNPAPASDWGQCWDAWNTRTVEFDFDVNLSNKLQFFWNQKEIAKGATFEFKNFSMKKAQ